ncbi:MAG: DUF2127 domain-containing protein [Gemmatimonadaceae bacterium]|nr:DUF2127 domain-containing protein [Gemmatimonadaceae bacterium]
MTATPVSLARTAAPPPNRRALRAIALFKFGKALAFVALAATAFGLLGDDVRNGALERLTELATSLARATEFSGVRGWLGGVLETVVHGLLHLLGNVTATKLQVAGFVALSYALVLTVEGAGLWLAKTWAEWFSVVVTASLIPFELWEVAHRFTPVRVGILVLNVAVVWYLVRTIRANRAAHRG